MKFNEALKELHYKRNKKFILYGEESYLKDTFLKAAIHPEINPFFYYPGDESGAQSTLYSSSLFDEDQFVVLYYYDEMKTKGFKEVIQKYKGHLFVVLSPEANLKTAALTEMAGLCLPVQCSKMSEYSVEYPSWLVTKASERGYLFVDDAETLLYKKVGPDMALLHKELEKLMLYKEESKSILPSDVEKVVSFSVINSNFDLLDFLLKKDIPKALTTLDMYLKNSDDLDSLIYFLGNYFEKMYRMLILNSQKTSAEGIASILNIPVNLIKSKYLSKALSIGPGGLGGILERIVALEVGLRSTAFKNFLLYRFIFSFA